MTDLVFHPYFDMYEHLRLLFKQYTIFKNRVFGLAFGHRIGGPTTRGICVEGEWCDAARSRPLPYNHAGNHMSPCCTLHANFISSYLPDQVELEPDSFFLQKLSFWAVQNAIKPPLVPPPAHPSQPSSNKKILCNFDFKIRILFHENCIANGRCPRVVGKAHAQ